MNENIFDKRRLKTFSNCKDLVKSMVGTRDGVIVYNERFRVDLETTCYKASMCEDLQKENQQLKEEKERLKNCYSNITIVGRQQGRAYEQAQNYILACDLLGLKDIKITLIDSEDKKRIEKAIEYIENNRNTCYMDEDITYLLNTLKGEEK